MLKGWRRADFRECVEEIRSGKSVNSIEEPASSDQIGVLKTSCVYNGRFEPRENKSVVREEQSLVKCPVTAGTIIVSRMNTADLVGASGYVDRDHPNIFLPDRLWAIFPKHGVDPVWLYYVTASPEIRARLSDNASGTSASMKNISQDVFLSMPARIPPLPEQRKIAEILRTWDEAIEKLGALRAAKEQQFRGLQQKLIDPDFKSYGDTLEQYVLIPNLEKITSADGLKPLTVKLHCKGIMANGRNVQVTLSDKGRPYYRRKSGDLLIGRQNFHNGGFGILPSELDGFIASNAITSLRVDSSKADVHYFFYFFSRKNYYLRIGHIMDGTGQKELSDKQIRKLPVSIPSLEKQVEVAQILNAANAEISLIDTKINALTRQKRGLMQKLLTGEWRVKVEGTP